MTVTPSDSLSACDSHCDSDAIRSAIGNANAMPTSTSTRATEEDVSTHRDMGGGLDAKTSTIPTPNEAGNETTSVPESEPLPARTTLPLVPPAPPVLRAYQVDAVARLNTALAGGKRPLLVAPTGSGKTVILADLIRAMVGLGLRVVFLAPRRELVRQTCAKLDDVGIEHGVLLAGEDTRAGI